LLTAQQSSAASARDRLRENASDADVGLEREFTLRFFDAVSGEPIRGATLQFEGKKQVSNEEGAVTFAIPAGLGHESMRYVRFQREGYVSSKLPVQFMVGELFFNRYSVSPSLSSGRLRIVVDWSSSPPDLDAHLVKQGSYHISYQDMRKVEDHAELDRDDRDGQGPETITLLNVDSTAHYEFYVHDYSSRGQTDSTSLGKSRARVSVYSPDGLLQSFGVPANGAGLLWKVFTIEGGQVQAVNQLTE